MSQFIEISHMFKIYNPGEHEVRALNDVSLSISQGEFVAIVGQSGSGKSTLMNMLGCLDTPCMGNYFLDGQDVSQLSEKQLSHIRNQSIGFVFQGFNLIPSLSAIENVELPLMYRNCSREKRRALATDALCRVGLVNRMNHRPAEMSGGQQQRVAIARAIAAHPPIVLADEPTGNLDSHSGREVMHILEALWREGRTVILITHDSDIARRAKRIIRLQDGSIDFDRQNQPEDVLPLLHG